MSSSTSPRHRPPPKRTSRKKAAKKTSHPVLCPTAAATLQHDSGMRTLGLSEQELTAAILVTDHSSNSNDSDCSRHSSLSYYNGLPNSPKQSRQPTPPPSVPALPSPSCSHQLHQSGITGGNAPIGGANVLGGQQQAHAPNHVHHSYDLRRKLSSHFPYHEGLIANQVSCVLVSSSASTSSVCSHSNSTGSTTANPPVPRHKRSRRSCSICNSPNSEGESPRSKCHGCYASAAAKSIADAFSGG